MTSNCWDWDVVTTTINTVMPRFLEKSISNPKSSPPKDAVMTEELF